jgi:hypothetical protein
MPMAWRCGACPPPSLNRTATSRSFTEKLVVSFVRKKWSRHLKTSLQIQFCRPRTIGERNGD